MRNICTAARSLQRHSAPTVLALILAASGILASSASQALEAPLAADSYISITQPTVNFGTLPTLNVGGGAAALLRFDLGTLPPATTAAKLVKANLVIYVNRVGTPGAVDINPVNSAWAEAGLSFNTSPRLEASVCWAWRYLLPGNSWRLM